MINFKNIQQLFDAMQSIGIKEVYLSRITHKDIYESMMKWFMNRSKNVDESKYVWLEHSYPGTSFVRNGKTREYEDHLKITFVDYKL